MKKRIYSLCVFLPSTFVFAQGADVVLEGESDRSVEPAYRIALTPSMIDTTIPMETVEYPMLVLKYNTDTDLEKINPVSLKINETLSKLYHTYVKLGVGSEFMPLGEMYFDAKRSRKYMYGAHLKHLSSFGNLPDYAPAQFDRTRINVYGGINQRRYTLRGDIHYNNQGFHYYGIRQALADSLGLFKDSLAQRYSDFGIGGSFASHKKDSGNVNFKIGLNYNRYGSRKPGPQFNPDWRARENFLGIRTGAWYQMGEHRLEGDLNVLHNSYMYGADGVLDTSFVNSLDTALRLRNTIVNLYPRIITHLQDDRFRVQAGLNLLIDGHERTQAYVYPMLEVKYSMFNDIFIPYVGIRGGTNQTTFKSLTQDNEFLLPNLHMQNENTRIELYGGIKGTISRRIGFNANASFADVRGLAMYVNDTTFSRGNKFDVIFDTAKVARIEGSMYFQLKEKMKVDVLGRLNSYNMRNNAYAWNRPTLEFMLRGSYNLADKLLLNMDMKLEHGRKALVYTPEDNVTWEDNQLVKNLGFLADANIGLEYRYSPRLSAFIQANNVAAQRYMRYHNTPVQAFQVMGGITARF